MSYFWSYLEFSAFLWLNSTDVTHWNFTSLHDSKTHSDTVWQLKSQWTHRLLYTILYQPLSRVGMSRKLCGQQDRTVSKALYSRVITLLVPSHVWLLHWLVCKLLAASRPTECVHRSKTYDHRMAEQMLNKIDHVIVTCIFLWPKSLQHKLLLINSRETDYHWCSLWWHKFVSDS